MRQPRTKVLLIGVGAMGKNHARILSHLSGAKLFGIFDVNQEAAGDVASLYKAKVFPSYQEALPLVDAVIIVSPTSTHYALAKACLEANKPLFVEKPLAVTAEESLSLANLAKDKNLLLSVGFIERFNPAFVELAKLLRKSKTIGLTFQRFSPFPERISDANVIIDMMIHDLDLLLALRTGHNDDVESIKAVGKKIKSSKLDKVSATVYFKSGLIAKVEADRTAEAKTRKIIATTENEVLEADLLSKKLIARTFQHNLPSVHHVKEADQLTSELTNFIQAIRNNTAPLVDGYAGYNALKLAEEVEQACS